MLTTLDMTMCYVLGGIRVRNWVQADRVPTCYAGPVGNVGKVRSLSRHIIEHGSAF